VTGSRGTYTGLLALAFGGFAIGTTEFATMGILPDIAHDLREAIPTPAGLERAQLLRVVVLRAPAAFRHAGRGDWG
jgi:DHA1 family inner membrane transport protein